MLAHSRAFISIFMPGLGGAWGILSMQPCPIQHPLTPGPVALEAGPSQLLWDVCGGNYFWRKSLALPTVSPWATSLLDSSAHL